MQIIDNNQHHLLAIDLGARCGMALFSQDGRLCWYRSQQFSNTLQLKRFAAKLFARTPNPVTWLITEGDISLAVPWERVAMRQGTRVQRVTETAWQDYFLTHSPSQQATRHQLWVQALAQRVIAWSGLPVPLVLSYDAAEAILIGFWGVFSVGWLRQMPLEVLQTARLPLSEYRLDVKMT